MAQREIEAILKIKDQLSAGVQKANKSLKDINKQLGRNQKALDKVGKHTGFKNLAGSIIGAQVAMRAASVFFRQFVSGAVAAQSTQEQAINQLNLALANQGNLLAGTGQRLQEYASSLQQVTTFGDEQILQAQSMLASFGMNEEQLKRSTKVALDFAATGKDLGLVMNLLGKAFVGETGELSRYGIIIDKNIPKTEKFAEVMRQLEVRFGGQAQAAVQTFSGRLKQFENAAGDAQEGLGFFIGQLLDFGSAGGVGVGVMEWIGKVFREDFVLALGLARKAFTSWVSFFLSIWQGLLGAMGRMPGALGKPFKAAADYIDNLRVGLKTAGDEMLVQAHAAAEAGAQTLEFANNTNVATRATEEAARASEEAAKKADKFAKVIETKMNPAFRKYYASLLDTNPQVKGLTFAHIEATGRLDKWGQSFLNFVPQVNVTTQGIVAATTATADFANVLQQAANLTTVFGKTLGGIFGGGASAIGGFSSLFGKEGGGFGFGALTKQFKDAGKFSLGSILSGLSSTLPAIGALAGPAIKAIQSLIGSIFEGANIAETVERDFGTQMSAGLKASLENLAKQTGDLSTAAQLGLGDIFGEALATGSADLDLFAERIADTFSFLERGQITATEAQTILNETVAQLLPHLDQLGPEGEAQIQRLINAAQEFGITFEGLAQLGGPIASSVEDIANEFGITLAQAKELADFLDVTVKTNVQKIAEELGIHPKLLREIGEAVENQFGIPLEGIQGLLATMGIDIEDLALAFGIDLPAAAAAAETAVGGIADEAGRAADNADRLGREIGNIPRTVNIDINERHQGDNSDIPGRAIGGWIPKAPTPFGQLYRLGEREPELVIPKSAITGNSSLPGSVAQPKMMAPIVLQLDRRVLARVVAEIVNDKKATGRIQ